MYNVNKDAPNSAKKMERLSFKLMRSEEKISNNMKARFCNYPHVFPFLSYRQITLPVELYI